jgi:hypothetical protein
MTERDDAVSKRYRELPVEEPPRALDEAILAASRRAVHTHPAPLVAPAGRQRWYVPLAAAAVIVLAVGLTLRVQLEEPAMREVTPPSPKVLESPAQPKKDEVMAREEPVAKAEAKPAPERRMAQARERRDLGESRAQGPASAPAPFPAQPAPAPAAKPDAERRAEARAMQGAPAAEAPAPAAPPAAAARAAPQAEDAARDRAESRALASGATAKQLAQAEETPERMLERIAELRRNGRHDEADKALAEFRKRYPEYKLSDEMKAKVERR